MSDESPAPKKRSRKLYVLWGVALTLLLAAGAFCWAVVVPVWQVHSALGWDMNHPDFPPKWGPGSNFDEKNRKAARESIKQLGGASAAAPRILRYGQMPEWLASRREQAAWTLAECEEDAVPLMLDALPRQTDEDKSFLGSTIALMQDSEEANRRLVQEAKSPDPERRYWVATWLGWIACSDAEKPLRELLNDEAPRVRAQAKKSLSMIESRTK